MWKTSLILLLAACSGELAAPEASDPAALMLGQWDCPNDDITLTAGSGRTDIMPGPLEAVKICNNGDMVVIVHFSCSGAGGGDDEWGHSEWDAKFWLNDPGLFVDVVDDETYEISDAEGVLITVSSGSDITPIDL